MEKIKLQISLVTEHQIVAVNKSEREARKNAKQGRRGLQA
jgi:hypothetical protein